MSTATAFTQHEVAIIYLARMVEADKSYWTPGGGRPGFAVSLAQKLNAPNLMRMTEEGCISAQPYFPVEPFMYMGSARSSYRGVIWTSMNQVCYYNTLGLVDYAILMVLEIDPYGNFNSSMIGGDYYHPERRFGGAGGANEMASLAWRTLLVTDQDKRKFVKKCNFITSPGYLDGSPDARERAGMPKNTGPYRVVTSEAIFGYDERSHYMKLLAISSWTTVEEVLSKMDFEPLMADKVETLKPPTEEELNILRTQMDPEGRVIGAGEWIVLD